MNTMRDRVAVAVKRWCKKQGIKLTCEPCHIHPRAYVVGEASPQMLIVSIPWVDSEKQCMEWDKKYTLVQVREYHVGLIAGDWCSTAYVCDESGNQQTVAIPAVAGPRRGRIAAW